MMIYENKNGLKGQHNLAQGNPGKTGSSPGLENGHENRPRDNVFLNGRHYFGRKGMNPHSVRKMFFALIIVFARTGSFILRFPQALPGARINWPFRPEFVFKE
jgi:hypothetical protein